MAKRESEVYQDFRQVLAPLNIHIERIENAAKSGIFDVAISRSGKTLWIELKRSIYGELEASQFSWAIARYGVGCTQDMYVVAPSDKLWCVFNITEVLLANGKLRFAKGVTAMPSEDLRLFVKEWLNGR